MTRSHLSLRKPALRKPTVAVAATLSGAMVTGLVAGVAYNATLASADEYPSHTVTLAVDGVAQTVTTRAQTVSDLIQSAGLELDGPNQVSPAAGRAVEDGTRVDFTTARPVLVTVDGRPRTVRVAAPTVGAVADELGLTPQTRLSAPRWARVPVTGMVLTASTLKTVTVVVESHRVPLSTNFATVEQVLAQADVAVHRGDKVSAVLTSAPTAGQVITVTRKPPAPKRVVAPRASRSSARQAPAHSPSADGLNWAALAQCESGGNPHAVSSTGKYRGLYQFSYSTWASVGGSGDPAAASSGEQTYRAQRLYASSGRAPWPVCGSRL